MKIVDIRDIAVRLQGDVANAVVSFAEHDVSLIAVVSDVIRAGRPVVGFAFNSIGRFAQTGILRERVIPRLRVAAASDLLDAEGRRFDPAKIAAVAMRNEKPGGHGDRAGAVAALELAIWDLNAKLAGEPACQTIARAFGRSAPAATVHAYAAGGYYYPGDSANGLRNEFAAYRDLGFTAFKMKIGGAPLAQDLARIEAALALAGDGGALAVDANGRFDLDTALAYAQAIAPYRLRWYEEIGDPLDFDLNRRLAERYEGAIATGENLFSAADSRNLLLFGGMRPGLDLFQMDAGLSYGLGEFVRMIALMEQHGFDRRQAVPHGGHLINLHIVLGLGLGGCECYPGVFQPFGGYPAVCMLGAGEVRAADAPGFGLEQKLELRPFLAELCPQAF
ncbi:MULTISPECIES: enolase C-terminal domain-like protein [unclassified Bosea (in: a-proteobacteria)]|uniref:enolase C-terminal domain-like protein n=1 Tax=unclassified Bosea (in: a-proteobacteria) TaxID=2653178 RepID=UPI000F7647D8|nr:MULTISPECIES: enolase C-terminal domain-like protein [unclassified Bosea (in: a-proteobacteria)]AZO80656.1 mandelate racemase [Bosea sp. Tri-49]RXT25617.1 mandelate racemase [Bosea sp. Tri-39]RXT30858.1 mandelate racemase [Bosea sp. Tri-54]